MIVDVSKVHTLVLGKAGEYGSHPFDFDCSSLISEYGSGTGAIVYKQPGVSHTHPIMATYEDPYIHWVPDYDDMKNAGRGCIEIDWFVNDSLAKSKTINIIIYDSLSNDSGSEETSGWLDQITLLYSEIVDLADQLRIMIEDNQEIAETARTTLETAINEINAKKDEVLTEINSDAIVARIEYLETVLLNPIVVGEDGLLHISEEDNNDE